jgi:hypothetical protein
MRLSPTDDIPVAEAPFKVSPDKRSALDAILQEYLQRDIIEPSDSPYAAPAFLVSKRQADGSSGASHSYRLVEDYSALNKKLVPNRHPVPSVQELLDSLGRTNAYFCTLDLRQGYHHVPLTMAARRRTAFLTPAGQFQYKRLPYGLSTAPRIFQRNMEKILHRQLFRTCIVYIDDVLVFGPTFSDLLANLEDIFFYTAQRWGCTHCQQVQVLGRKC